MAILPITTSVRGPAPASPADEEDIIDETIKYFRANVFFRNFEVQVSERQPQTQPSHAHTHTPAGFETPSSESSMRGHCVHGLRDFSPVSRFLILSRHTPTGRGGPDNDLSHPVSSSLPERAGTGELENGGRQAASPDGDQEVCDSGRVVVVSRRHVPGSEEHGGGGRAQVILEAVPRGGWPARRGALVLRGRVQEQVVAELQQGGVRGGDRRTPANPPPRSKSPRPGQRHAALRPASVGLLP